VIREKAERQDGDASDGSTVTVMVLMLSSKAVPSGPRPGVEIGASAETREKKRMNTHLTRCSYDERECKIEYKKGLYFIPSPGMHMLSLRWAYCIYSTDAA
jgi:hypothetical protein